MLQAKAIISSLDVRAAAYCQCMCLFGVFMQNGK